jgi:hypothetical protein
MKTFWYRWRLALSIAALKRAGATGDPAAITKAATELRALATMIAASLPGDQVRRGAAKAIAACNRILADVAAAA